MVIWQNACSSLGVPCVPRVLCWNYIQGSAYPPPALALAVPCSVTWSLWSLWVSTPGPRPVLQSPKNSLLMSAEAVCQQGVLGSTRNVSSESGGSLLLPPMVQSFPFFFFSLGPAEVMATVLEMGKLRLRGSRPPSGRQALWCQSYSLGPALPASASSDRAGQSFSLPPLCLSTAWNTIVLLRAPVRVSVLAAVQLQCMSVRSSSKLTLTEGQGS